MGGGVGIVSRDIFSKKNYVKNSKVTSHMGGVWGCLCNVTKCHMGEALNQPKNCHVLSEWLQTTLCDVCQLFKHICPGITCQQIFQLKKQNIITFVNKHCVDISRSFYSASNQVEISFCVKVI